MAFPKISRTLSALEIYDLVRTDLADVEKEIGLESISSVDAVTYIGQYLQTSGGKRLRPILVLLSGKLLGSGSSPTLTRMAAVMEMVHTATLVHDDVIDLAKTRRGRPSINVVWGNHTSVLSGDWLYMQAFQVALRERSFPILDLLIGLTQKMVEGELLQLEHIGKIGVTETDYFELIDRKTASLFAACARLGAICAGATAEQQESLGQYAWNLGIAFQLVDDILDFTSREKVLGKPVGNDLREGKVTLPLIYALEHADSEERKLVETVLADGSYDQVPFGKILQILNKHRGIERTQQRAQAYTERSRELIRAFPESPYQKALLAVTDLVTERDH